MDLLYGGAIENVEWLRKEEGVEHSHIDLKFVAKLQEELRRLTKEETEHAEADLPSPSSGIAFYLLSGLAKEGTVVRDPTESDRKVFGLETRGGVRTELIEVRPNVRIVMIDRRIQDESGDIRAAEAILCVRDGGRWLSKGGGRIAPLGPVSRSVRVRPAAN